MCEPATLATLATIGSTAMTAYSSIQQGKAAADQGIYNSAVQSNNAIKAENKGVEAENNKRVETALLRKQQEAQFGAGNVQLGSGSAADILAQTDNYGEVEALNIRKTAKEEAEQYRIDSVNERLKGKNARNASNVNAFGTMLGGVGRVASKNYARRKK